RKAWEAYQQQLASVAIAEQSYTTARQLLKLVQLRTSAPASPHWLMWKLAQQGFEDAGYRLTNYRYAAKSAGNNPCGNWRRLLAP
ncbi:MAG: hypothetical protein WKG07_33335, partial [Hymenobacter sp.]